MLHVSAVNRGLHDAAFWRSTAFWMKNLKSKNRDLFKRIQNIYSTEKASVFDSILQATNRQTVQSVPPAAQWSAFYQTTQLSRRILATVTFRSGPLVPILLCCKEIWIRICAAARNCFQISSPVNSI